MSEATYQHLKDETYYNELYDCFTIEECRRWEASEAKESDKTKAKSDEDKLKKIKKRFKVKIVFPMALYFVKGERYKKKSATISSWMARDRMRDAKVADAQEPKGIRCLKCSSLMNYTSRDLQFQLDEKQDRVLFFFECPHCGKRRAYWEDGEEWQPEADRCPKCGKDMDKTHARKGDVITTYYSCPSCGHKETDAWDLSQKIEEKIYPNFAADRQKYCLSDKEGQEYISQCLQLEHFSEMLKGWDKNKNLNEAVAKMKKLTIAELKNLLNPIVEKACYIKFELGKPELNRDDVIMEFSIQDNKPGRAEYDSVQGLKRLIKQALSDTNWRLISEGISYSLGLLNGRFRGVEGEEKLRDLISGRKKKSIKKDKINETR